MTYALKHLNETLEIIKKINIGIVEKIVNLIYEIKKNQGRIFFLGVGGSAANCSHAVNDFRKIVEIESYTPTDNISELTARTNDEGWESVFEHDVTGYERNIEEKHDSICAWGTIKISSSFFTHF